MLDLELVNCFVEEATDLLATWEGVCLKLEKGATADDLNSLFRCAHNLKGSSRSVGLEAFGAFVHKIEDGISILKEDPSRVTKPVLLLLLKAQAMLLQWIGEVRTNPTFALSYESFVAEYQEGLSGSAPAEATESKPNSDQAHAQSSSPVVEKKPTTQATNGIPDETLRVSAKKLDQILEMVGELSIHQSIIWHGRQEQENESAALAHSFYLSRKITKDLYERALSLRMYPVQPIFQRLERSIREISIELGKNVEIETIGGDVELDKAVYDKIVEPLTHMVRNSVDHGLETNEQRIQSGKTTAGKVRIIAAQESGSVTLTIEDDGRGLNPEKILQKAKSNEIWNGSSELTKAEILALIFLPGFSTAEKVTAVSGRGVGMDVVMRTIESLSGHISIDSEVGRGTRFIITIPTSLSIIDALIVGLGQIEYALPVSSIDEVLNFSDLGLDSSAKAFNLRGNVLPIEPLTNYLSPESSEPFKPSTLLITHSGNRRLAYAVGKVTGPQQIVVRKLVGSMASAFGFSGGTILSDGKPGLIIDLPQISSAYLKNFQKLETAA